MYQGRHAHWGSSRGARAFLADVRGLEDRVDADIVHLEGLRHVSHCDQVS